MEIAKSSVTTPAQATCAIPVSLDVAALTQPALRLTPVGISTIVLEVTDSQFPTRFMRSAQRAWHGESRRLGLDRSNACANPTEPRAALPKLSARPAKRPKETT